MARERGYLSGEKISIFIKKEYQNLELFWSLCGLYRWKKFNGVNLRTFCCNTEKSGLLAVVGNANAIWPL